jgi:hypothetical protein
MADHKETQGGPPFWLQPVYTDARAAIVQPDRRIDATQYFRDKWLPRLGAVRWTLVLGLRGLCAEAPLQPDGTREVEVTRGALAELLGVDEKTVSRILKSERAGEGPWRILQANDKQSEYLSLFIPRLRYSVRVVQDPDGLERPKRSGYLLHVLMDDPLVPEDEARLPEVAGQRVASQLAAERCPEPVEGMGHQATFSPLPGPAVRDKMPLKESPAKDRMSLMEPAAKDRMSLAGPSAKDKMSFRGSPAEDKTSFAEPARDKMSPVTLTLTNKLTTYLQEELNLELTRRRELRQALKPIVEVAEEILDDHHSTAMLFKVLLALYPHHLDLFTAAVEEAVAVGELDEEVNRGAVFVNVLKDLAADAGVELGLQGESAAETRDGPPVVSPAYPELCRGGEPSAPEVEPGEGESGGGVPATEADRFWQAALGELRLQMTKATFDTWVRNTRLVSCQDDVFVIGTQNEFARNWLENRLLTTVKRTLVGIVGHPVEVQFVTRDS